MDKHLKSLLDKLDMLSSQDEIELTPYEAELYGVDYADILPPEEYQEGSSDE